MSTQLAQLAQSAYMERASSDTYGINYDDPPPLHARRNRRGTIQILMSVTGPKPTTMANPLLKVPPKKSKDLTKRDDLSASMLSMVKSSVQRLHKSYTGLCEDEFDSGLSTEQAIRGGRTP
jgi:hypothetical protein